MSKKIFTSEQINEQLVMHIPYRVMLMTSCCQEPQVFIDHPNMVGAFFACQAIALIKVRDLFDMLTQEGRDDDLTLANFSEDWQPLNEEKIGKENHALLKILRTAANKAEAHTTCTTNSEIDFCYGDGKLEKGIGIVINLLDEYVYKPRGQNLQTAMTKYLSWQQQNLKNHFVKTMAKVNSSAA